MVLEVPACDHRLVGMKHSAHALMLRFAGFLGFWFVLDGLTIAGLLVGLGAATLATWVSLRLLPPSRNRRNRASPAFARGTFSLELRRIRSGRGRPCPASPDAAPHRSCKLQMRDFHRPQARSLSRHEQPHAGFAAGGGIGRRPNRRALSGHDTASGRSNEGSRGPACPGGGSPLGGCVSFSLQPRSLSWRRSPWDLVESCADPLTQTE